MKPQGTLSSFFKSSYAAAKEPEKPKEVIKESPILVESPTENPDNFKSLRERL